MTRRIATLTLLALVVGTGAIAAQGSEAAAALNRGSMFERRADYPQAYAAYREASRRYGSSGDRDGVSRALSAVAHLHVVLGRFPEALAVIDSAFGIQLALNAKLPTDESREGLARTLRQRGEVLAQLGKLDSAAAAFDSASSYFASAKTAGRRQGAAGVLAARGALEGKRLRYQDAIRFYEQARGLYHELGDQNAEAQQLDSIAYYQSRQGGCEKAIAVFEQAYQLHLATRSFDDAGFSQSQIGQCRWRLGNAARAIAAHTLAIDLRKRAGDRSGVAYSLVQLAGLYRESGDPRRALDTLAGAVAIYKALGDAVAEADARSRIGALYGELKDAPRALQQYRAALAIQRTIHDAAGRATTVYSVGALYFDLERDDSAETYLRSALELQREAVDLPGQIRTLALLGRIAQRYDGNDSSASNYLKNALALAERTGDPAYVASCYVSLAQLFEQRGKYDSALAYRGRAADLYRKTQDAVRLGTELLEIGRLYVTSGDFTAARALMDSALAAGQRSGNRGLIGGAYRSLAGLHSLQGEYQQALALGDSALRIGTEVKNPWARAATYVTLGETYGALAEYGKALGYYELADSIYVALGDSLARFVPLNDMGKIHFWQGNYDRALFLYQGALGALTRAHVVNEDRAVVLGNIGEVEFELRRYPEALRRLNDALSLADSMRATHAGADARTLLGKVTLAQGQFTQARQYLDSAYGLRVSMNELDRLAEVDAEIGKLHYQVGDLKRARRALQESIGTSHRIGSDKYLWEPLYTLALVARDQGDTAESLTLLEEAVDVLEALADRVVGGEAAQKLFLSGAVQSQVYGTLIGLLNSSGQSELAFQYGERSRAASTRLRYRNMGIKLQDTSVARLVTQLRDLRATADRLAETAARRRAADTAFKASAATASIETARSVAETEYQAFVRDVMSKRDDMRRYLSAPLDFRRVKGTIPGDLAVVAYFAGPDSLYVFIATHTDVTGRIIPISQAQLDEKVRLLVRAASTPPTARDTARTGVARSRNAGPRLDFFARSADLYQLLIAPVDSLIGTRRQLAIMPSGELYYLPFQMLGHRRRDSTFSYLDDDRTVFYLDRMRVDTLTPPRTLPRIMAFGNADGTLSSAQQEVEEIHTIFPASRILVRDSATEASARSVPDQFNVLHFATHGSLDYKKFENSYLTLAPGGGQDGRLTLGEVWGDTTLAHRQLVVLSACNTAVTDTAGGLPESPAIGFLDGGVKTVIASLWPVNDVATSQLMADFYRNLATMSKDEALRAAQRSLRANPKYAHPYYWSAWVLIGDWR